MSNHEDSTRTARAKAEALARRQTRQTRYAAKRDTDAAVKILARSIRYGGRFA